MSPLRNALTTDVMLYVSCRPFHNILDFIRLLWLLLAN
jgi:hypothetical protein